VRAKDETGGKEIKERKETGWELSSGVDKGRKGPRPQSQLLLKVDIRDSGKKLKLLPPHLIF